MQRDDIIEYSLDAHHSEEAGKKIRKKIWKVTAILTIVTAIEVLVGAFFGADPSVRTLIKFSFIGMTILKAGYIVMVFMHLGDERKAFRWIILLPYTLFILYLLWILFTEANTLYYVRELFGFIS